MLANRPVADQAVHPGARSLMRERGRDLIDVILRDRLLDERREDDMAPSMLSSRG